jgi:hypothetical protein
MPRRGPPILRTGRREITQGRPGGRRRRRFRSLDSRFSRTVRRGSRTRRSGGADRRRFGRSGTNRRRESTKRQRYATSRQPSPLPRQPEGPNRRRLSPSVRTTRYEPASAQYEPAAERYEAAAEQYEPASVTAVAAAMTKIGAIDSPPSYVRADASHQRYRKNQERADEKPTSFPIDPSPSELHNSSLTFDRFRGTLLAAYPQQTSATQQRVILCAQSSYIVPLRFGASPTRSRVRCSDDHRLIDSARNALTSRGWVRERRCPPPGTTRSGRTRRSGMRRSALP